MQIRHTEFCPNRHTERKPLNASPMDKYNSVGERLRAYRERAGYKQNVFAQLIGIKAPSLSEIESGTSKNPAALTLLKAAQVLGIDAMYLLTGEGVPIRAVQLLAPDEMRLFVLYRELSDDGKREVDRMVNAIYAQEFPTKAVKTIAARSRRNA